MWYGPRAGQLVPVSVFPRDNSFADIPAELCESIVDVVNESTSANHGNWLDRLVISNLKY